MGKPFRLTFDYTPKFSDNRKREPKDQFTVTLSDISIQGRLSALESLTAEAPDPPEAPKDRRQTPEEFQAQIAAQRKQVEWRKRFVMPHIVRVNGLSVTDKEDKDVEVKTGEDLEKFLPDVVQELANRLLLAADEDELKNSQSPSAAGSSGTAPSEPATSTATATAS